MTSKFFINRRTGSDRRTGMDQRQNPRLDLSHRRRRKRTERRSVAREILDDFYAIHDFTPEDFRFFGDKH